MPALGLVLDSSWSPFSRRSLGNIGVAWTIIALLSAGTTAATRARAGGDPLLGVALADAGLACAIFAVLTPFVLAAGRRWSLGRFDARTIAIHAGAVVVYCVVGAMLTNAATWMVKGTTLSMSSLLLSSAFASLLTYAVTIGVARLIDVAMQLRDQQRQLTVARLHALTGQLRPHFLFNALNAVATLIPRDPPAAERLVLDVSRLLRMSLERGEEANVRLADEIELIEAYVAVMRARIGERLCVSWSVPADLRAARVPQLLLLPLVENAVQHGIAPAEDAGQLSVNVSRENRHLRITITDDGPGLPPSILEGFGLAATRARLARQFENDFELALRGAGLRGAAATVRLPLLFA